MSQSDASVSPRRTRQRTKQLASVDSPAPTPIPTLSLHAEVNTPLDAVKPLADPIPIAVTKLSRRDHQLLHRKHDRLRKYSIDVPKDFERHSAAVDATLIFGQEEAGTAVCIAPEGLLLTCAHCIAESTAELDADKHWLLFASGRIIAAKCIVWDPRRDLALLQITAAQPCPSRSISSPQSTLFPSVQIASVAPAANARLVCLGHPGSEDLEDVPGTKTNYDVLHLSTGAFRGYAEGQDLQDNSEIGALQHDCWTYWGHSGAPLLDRKDGRIVGLHSSWDDETTMRRGIPLEAVRGFLAEHGVQLRAGS